MSDWDQPTCDRCWETIPESDGGGMISSTQVRVPVAISESMREVETCGFCKKDTLSGIYVRRDPKLMP